MHPLGRLHARRAAQTDHGALLFVEPVLDVLDLVLALDLDVLLVRLGDGLGRQSLDVPVDVDVEGPNLLRLVLVVQWATCAALRWRIGT